MYLRTQGFCCQACDPVTGKSPRVSIWGYKQTVGKFSDMELTNNEDRLFIQMSKQLTLQQSSFHRSQGKHRRGRTNWIQSGAIGFLRPESDFPVQEGISDRPDRGGAWEIQPDQPGGGWQVEGTGLGSPDLTGCPLEASSHPRPFKSKTSTLRFQTDLRDSTPQR